MYIYGLHPIIEKTNWPIFLRNKFKIWPGKDCEVEEKEYTGLVPDTKEYTDCSNLRVCGHQECSKPCNSGCYKLETYDWLEDISEITSYTEVVEVRFKNTRKAFYQNANNLRLDKGEIVAVEASPGHDIGVVSMVGQLVRRKMLIENINPEKQELKKVYRKAKSVDIDKWREAIGMEHKTMIKSRQIAEDLGLSMKIGDVEYQGDRTKAIFYYIADERVDFRQLIKVLADEFKIRIEMRQIGARQEAGRIGGIGSCGRELCCASFVTNFVSVTTNAARYQEVSLNPQKLAGQCSKLKCCLNYELDAYLDAQKDFPDTSVKLKTKNGVAYHRKTDVFKNLMWYELVEDEKKTLTCMDVESVKEIIEDNKNKKYPETLTGIEEAAIASVVDYQNSAGLESLTRFEDKPGQTSNKRKKKKPRYDKRGGKGNPNQQKGSENKNPNQKKKGSKPWHKKKGEQSKQNRPNQNKSNQNK